MNKEYEYLGVEDNYSETSVLLSSLRSQNATVIDNMQMTRRKFCDSFMNSILTTLKITLASIVQTSVAMVFLYVNMNTTYSCWEWQKRGNNNNTLPSSVKRVRVLGDCVESFEIYIWVPLTLMMLLGWKEFTTKFFSIVYIYLISGELLVIYQLICFQFSVNDGPKHYYRIPTYILFFASLFYACSMLLKTLRTGRRVISYSNAHIMFLFLVNFLFGGFYSYIYKYLIIPAFDKVREDEYKSLIAITSPVIGVFLNLVCWYIALLRSSEVIHPGRSFVLVYIIPGSVIFLFRTMQSDFKSTWVFVSLSLISAIFNFLRRVTLQIRYSFWSRVFRAFSCFHCCRRLHVFPWNTAHGRRLRADLAIQHMMSEYSSLVLSQAFFIFYQFQNFEIATETLSLEFLKRIAIAFGIDFIFHCLSNCIEMYYYNFPIGRVWRKNWKRHVLANTILLLTNIAYFNDDFMAVFRSHFQKSGESSMYVVKNCSFF
ncbi:uncharacterized protein LOC124450827 [Xenia sp. Carnegie-2017]|uniref:uncharacterized protein LOC124450827 n=1 Tax=Xenia sp. Carnegie-2017 TaxID=2897299 RepID=UPI001F033C8D|nr:uncharacterized protein LOC124450827 [Xenia sp. Carnegie-2017]